MSVNDPVTDIDLDAYVDDQLDPKRKIEVEDYLSKHGDEAMRVMADLRIRDALRYGVHAKTTKVPCERTVQLVKRLERAHFRVRLYSKLRPVAVAASLVTAGWLGHVGYANWTSVAPSIESAYTAPSFVDDALRAHRASLIRAGMNSQPEVPVLDTAEILASLGIVLPNMPGEWRIKDVQVFPSSSGPGVELVLETGVSRSLSIFVSRASVSTSAARAHSQFGDASIVYWQHGSWSYAMTGELPNTVLDQLASRLTFDSEHSIQ